MKTSFIVYLLGYGLVIAAIWWGVRQSELIGPPWPSIIALILIGLGLVYAYSRAQEDTARREQARSGQQGTQQNPPRQGGTQGGGAQQQGGGTKQGGGTQQA